MAKYIQHVCSEAYCAAQHLKCTLLSPSTDCVLMVLRSVSYSNDVHEKVYKTPSHTYIQEAFRKGSCISRSIQDIQNLCLRRTMQSRQGHVNGALMSPCSHPRRIGLAVGHQLKSHHPPHQAWQTRQRPWGSQTRHWAHYGRTFCLRCKGNGPKAEPPAETWSLPSLPLSPLILSPR